MRPQRVEASIAERGAYRHLDYLSLMTKRVTEWCCVIFSCSRLKFARNFEFRLGKALRASRCAANQRQFSRLTEEVLATHLVYIRYSARNSWAWPCGRTVKIPRRIIPHSAPAEIQNASRKPSSVFIP